LPSATCGPLHPLHFKESPELPEVVVEGNADDLESLGSRFMVEGLDLRKLLPARRAPAGPKINEHHLAFEIAQLKCGPVEGGQAAIEGMADARFLHEHAASLGLNQLRGWPGQDLVQQFLSVSAEVWSATKSSSA
jgi:hypothetical protein